MSNANFTLKGVAVPTSIADPAFDPNFVASPEFANFVAHDGGDPSLYISTNTAKEIFEQDIESFRTLLNTDNMREFYSMYDTGDFDGITLRFDLTGVS